MTPSAKAKVLDRIKQMYEDMQDMADTYEAELPYESACLLDAINALDLAMRRLRGQSTIIS